MSEQQQPQKKKRGRPAKGERVMTNAERQARWRAAAKEKTGQAHGEFRFSPEKDERGMTAEGYALNRIIEVKMVLERANYVATRLRNNDYVVDDFTRREINELHQWSLPALRSLEELTKSLPFHPHAMEWAGWTRKNK